MANPTSAGDRAEVVDGVEIRLLGPGDTALLHRIAADDEDFDLDQRGSPRAFLSVEAADAYLSDPSIRHWVALEDEVILAHLHCQIVRKHAGAPLELLLYEIGVRAGVRRRGLGRALLDTMFGWMESNGVAEVWVLADNQGAVEFYAACGFEAPSGMAVYLTRSLPS